MQATHRLSALSAMPVAHQNFKAFSAASGGDGIGTKYTANADADIEDSEHDIDAAQRLANRRQQLMEEARSDNPFIAAQLVGGIGGPAEMAVQRWVKSGGLDDLEGKGKPLPDRPAPPPFVSQDEHHTQEVINRMEQERPDMEEGEWRAAVNKAGLADVVASNTFGNKGGVR